MSRQGKHNTPDTAMVSAFDKNASRFTECICELRFYAVEQRIIMQRMEWPLPQTYLLIEAVGF